MGDEVDMRKGERTYRHAGKDACIGDEHIFCAVDLCVCVNYCDSTMQTVISAHFVGSWPIIGSARSDVSVYQGICMIIKVRGEKKI